MISDKSTGLVALAFGNRINVIYTPNNCKQVKAKIQEQMQKIFDKHDIVNQCNNGKI